MAPNADEVVLLRLFKAATDAQDYPQCIRLLADLSSAPQITVVVQSLCELAMKNDADSVCRATR